MQFKRHYTLEQARALLPQVREWLRELSRLQRELTGTAARLAARLAEGEDLGGPSVNTWVRHFAALQTLLAQFQEREIQIKSIERGLVDFPALRGGREVFLCWEQDEDDIEYWHELDAGYAGREKLKDNLD